MIKYYVCDRQNPKCCKSPQCGVDCWITTHEEYAVPGLQPFSYGHGSYSNVIVGIEAESYAQGYWAGKEAKDEP